MLTVYFATLHHSRVTIFSWKLNINSIESLKSEDLSRDTQLDTLILNIHTEVISVILHEVLHVVIRREAILSVIKTIICFIPVPLK
jgi:hypothetical protein